MSRGTERGPNVFTAVANTAAEGWEGMADTCPCEGPTRGTCDTSGMGLTFTGDTQNASATLDDPVATEVDIVFQ